MSADAVSAGPDERLLWWSVLVFIVLWTLGLVGIAVDIGSTWGSLPHATELRVIDALLWLMPFLLSPVLWLAARRGQAGQDRRSSDGNPGGAWPRARGSGVLRAHGRRPQRS